ncbi:MAG TPA: hypothetical protein VHT70_02230 [Candidatus Saccharimonadales bacterium]|jgi:hypothetical protein|nr:hypothetical protein [Candidatus Saccharimonadales bacterium]
MKEFDPTQANVDAHVAFTGEGVQNPGADFHISSTNRLEELPNGLTALDINLQITGGVKGDEGQEITEHVAARVVFTPDGKILDSGEAAPERPSFLDFRQPFDDTYKEPPIAEQHAAGTLLGHVGDTLFETLPEARGSGFLPGFQIVETYTDDARIAATKTDPDSPLRRSSGPSGPILRNITGAPQSVYIGEQIPGGTGKHSSYLLDRKGVARRWDGYGPNPETFRKGVIEEIARGAMLRNARQQGPAALQRLTDEMLADADLQSNPLFTARQGTNYLPVTKQEIEDLARLIRERLDDDQQ